jgi:hypothetical protein
VGLYFCNKFKIINSKGKCLTRQRNLVLHNLHRILSCLLQRNCSKDESGGRTC